MPITFSCTCCKSFTVADALAGKRTRCPACKSPLTVPVPDDEPELVEDLEVVEDDVEVVEDFEVVEDDSPAPYGLADDRPPVPARRPDPEPVEAAVEDDGRPDYFAAVYEGGVAHKPRIFRVYPDGDELLFVSAGPFNWSLVDAAVGRTAMRNMAIRNTVMYGAAGAGIGLLAAGAMAVMNAVDRRAVAQRAAALDPMTLDDLRAEVDADKDSFRVTAGDTTEARILPPYTGFLADKTGPQPVGQLKFKHDPTGKWTLLFLTKPDARAAIKAFRRVLGRDGVEVELRLKKDRPEGA